MRMIYLAAVVLLMALALGAASGYVAYMRGIQRGDLLLIVAWFVLLPVLAVVLRVQSPGSSIERGRVGVLARLPPVVGEYAHPTSLLVLVAPFFVLLGFSSAYSYPVWQMGWRYALGSVVTSIAVAWISKRVSSRLTPLKERWLRIAPWILCAISLAATVFVLSWPIQYQSVNTLRYFGQGILNNKQDDNQIVFNDGHGITLVYLDGYECPASNPVFAKPIYEGGGQLSIERRYWLRGPLLELLGKGYEFGRPPTD